MRLNGMEHRCPTCWTAWTSPVGPTEYAPFLDEIKDCWCYLCMEAAYARSLNSGHEHRALVTANVTRYEALKIGWHVRRTKAEYLALQPPANLDYPLGYVKLSGHSTEEDEPGKFRSRCGIGFGSL
jgi:hypothetical protein